LAVARLAETAQHTARLRDQLETGLTGMGAAIFGGQAVRIPNTCYFALPDIEGDTLVVKLDKAGFAVAAGAACSSVNPGQSHVLAAMGIDPLLARCAVRVSLGRDNTAEQVDGFLRTTQRIVAELRQTSSISF
jgi:cysteine desulfurase